MDPWFGAVLATWVAIGLLQKAIPAWFLSKRVQILRAAAEKHGLKVVQCSPTWGKQGASWIRTRAGPDQVEVKIVGGARASILVELPGRSGFHSLTIRCGKHEPAPGIADAHFDSLFLIAGSMRLLHAHLDAETRRLLILAGSARGLEIGDGSLRAYTSLPELHGLLDLVLAIDRRFTQPVDVAQCLARNAHQDPEAGVRLGNLRLLAHEFPDQPETLAALRAACADASPQVRLLAAKELGAEGREVLLELAEGTADDAASAEAVSILGSELPLDRVTTILNVALRRRRLHTARACLLALGQNRDAGAVRILAKVMAREQGELSTAAAKVLGTTGNPAADSSENPELLRAARQAIAAIQSRLPGATPGQLSLAPAEAGRLSLAQAETGQLSLASDPAGELSLGAELPDRQARGLRLE